MSDFKSNEYANLIGGKLYEPGEENPMIGFRGASRYAAESFRDCFALECQAMKRVRDDMGLTNVEIMIPFVRTLDEARNSIRLLEPKTQAGTGLPAEAPRPCIQAQAKRQMAYLRRIDRALHSDDGRVSPSTR
jgi:phosphoenolpyruvate synthase/pyruvate phosphate dikinase